MLVDTKAKGIYDYDYDYDYDEEAKVIFPCIRITCH